MEIRKISHPILRPWALTDAEAVYEQARNPKIGAMCGWSPYTGVTEGHEIIEHVLYKPYSFAIYLEDSKAIGSISLLFQNDSNLSISDRGAEMGYWLGEDFWGKDYATEAVQSAIVYAFEELSLVRLWSGTYQENTPPQRVLEKCGFHPRHTEEHLFSEPMGETHRAVIYALKEA